MTTRGEICVTHIRSCERQKRQSHRWMVGLTHGFLKGWAGCLLDALVAAGVCVWPRNATSCSPGEKLWQRRE